MNMDYQMILQRIEDLRTAFAWSLEFQVMLSVGQRICLNQERASWMQYLSSQNTDFPMDKPKYQIPIHLEAKVKWILKEVKMTNWVKKQEYYEY